MYGSQMKSFSAVPLPDSLQGGSLARKPDGRRGRARVVGGGVNRVL